MNQVALKAKNKVFVKEFFDIEQKFWNESIEFQHTAWYRIFKQQRHLKEMRRLTQQMASLGNWISDKEL